MHDGCTTVEKRLVPWQGYDPLPLFVPLTVIYGAISSHVCRLLRILYRSANIWWKDVYHGAWARYIHRQHEVILDLFQPAVISTYYAITYNWCSSFILCSIQSQVVGRQTASKKCFAVHTWMSSSWSYPKRLFCFTQHGVFSHSCRHVATRELGTWKRDKNTG